jgi:hypothetical protein
VDDKTNLVFLRSFVWPHEYYTLRSFLESNGIEVVMLDEMTITIDPLLSNAIGGIKMYVAEHDFDKANKLMEEFELNKEQNEEES